MAPATWEASFSILEARADNSPPPTVTLLWSPALLASLSPTLLRLLPAIRLFSDPSALPTFLLDFSLSPQN